MFKPRNELLIKIFEEIREDNFDAIKQNQDVTPEAFRSVIANNSSKILKLLIEFNRYNIFKYLLSLHIFDIQETEEGNTLLGVCFATYLEQSSDRNEAFAIALINQGADTDILFYDNNTCLHLALKLHLLLVARALVEKGADLDVKNDHGMTPFHMLFQSKIDPVSVVEGVGLMMYYGADATIYDHNGSLPFDLAVIYGNDVAVAQENLLYYTFDSSFEYKMSTEVLAELVEHQSPLIYHITNFVTEVVCENNLVLPLSFFLQLEPEYLQFIVKNFQMVNLDLAIYFWNPYLPKNCCDNLEILLNSCWASSVRKCLTQFTLDRILDNNALESDLTKFIWYLLSQGITISDSDMHKVYVRYGYCELFSLLLYMDIELSAVPKGLPALICNIHLDVKSLNFLGHFNEIRYMLGYFAGSNFKEYVAGTLQNVPSLTELARDATRKYIVKRFNLRTSCQFYTLLRRLPIAPLHRQILAFEREVY